MSFGIAYVSCIQSIFRSVLTLEAQTSAVIQALFGLDVKNNLNNFNEQLNGNNTVWRRPSVSR